MNQQNGNSSNTRIVGLSFLPRNEQTIHAYLNQSSLFVKFILDLAPFGYLNNLRHQRNKLVDGTSDENSDQ